MLVRAKSKNNASKTKKCIGEGHKKVQNQESDPPPLQLGTREQLGTHTKVQQVHQNY